jgi:hypothetical protein
MKTSKPGQGYRGYNNFSWWYSKAPYHTFAAPFHYATGNTSAAIRAAWRAAEHTTRHYWPGNAYKSNQYYWKKNKMIAGSRPANYQPPMRPIYGSAHGRVTGSRPQ